MRKELEIAGLEKLGKTAMVKANGGAKGGVSADHSNAGAALANALTMGIADGNDKRAGSLNKNIAKHP